MDMQKSNASRIRQILASMERSIDTARSRRVNAPGAANIRADTSAPSMIPDSASPARSTATPAMPSVSKANQVIGGPPAGGAPVNAPKPGAPDASQPPRLKARPKRFEGAFPVPFTQPAYRSQTG